MPRRGRRAASRRRAVLATARTLLSRSILDLSPGVHPADESLGHRGNVVVAHLLHRVGGESGAITASAVDDDLFFAGNRCLDSAFQVSAGDEQRAGNASEVPLTRFAYIEVDDGR